ncbi:growth arrest and DNA damage-inducible protein GADD45 alpha-like [Ruditapes philippinarum]|uniref:growth arrest and DNA damage-inducible protein GADD45 alpha-like n=1 Tax=Ruditapes philippinarum TaxID=129788 RepID=UPI00295B056B|nr:growth arrest and DNA damage-inducible protein GADD45 alpha-like [Ruditapes philippinarum]
MTYTENILKMDESKTKPPSTIGKAVKHVLVQAMEQDRVNYGVFECVDILERDTERVLVVILPDTKVKDAALRIQHTLIEAFCRENEVKVLKVDCATKISTIFTSTATKEQKERSFSTDFSCILVKNPEIFSKDDEFVSDYCENFILGGLVPHGCVEIPA